LSFQYNEAKLHTLSVCVDVNGSPILLGAKLISSISIMHLQLHNKASPHKTHSHVILSIQSNVMPCKNTHYFRHFSHLGLGFPWVLEILESLWIWILFFKVLESSWK